MALRRRHLLCLIAALVAALACAQSAAAYWSIGGSGSGSGTAATLPVGVAPTVSASGTTVTVTITQVSVVGQRVGAIGGGYEVRRYPALGGAGVLVPSGSCSSLVSGPGATLTCTETSTPRGDWKYAVTPVLLSWTSTESAKSSTIVIPPDPASALDADAGPAASVDLDWVDGAGATGYNVFRRTSLGSYNYAAPVNGATPVAGSSYTDTTAVSGTTYYYVVRSVVIGSGGQQISSGNSNEAGPVTADGTVPTSVTMSAVPATNRGTITLSGNASDTISGVDQIVFEYRTSPSGSWTEACTATISPYSCPFDTTDAADGLYDFRATAFDVAGNQASSANQTNKRIDNTAPTAALGALAAFVRGTITVSGTASDGGSGLSSVAIQIRAVGAPSWTTLCSSGSSPVSCSLNSTGYGDNDYELRVLATDAAGNTGSDTKTFEIDNTGPTVTITNPGSPLSGTELLESTTSDAGSGMASVQYQYKPTSGSVWSNACSSSTGPYSCYFDTTGVSDGLYDFRAVATDAAGNSTTSAAVTSRRIDNSAPASVVLTNPGTPLRGTITLNATAVDGGSGIANVQIQRSPAGMGTWTTICTDTTAPYSCSFDTTGVSDGSYDLRAVATDNSSNTTYSAIVTNRVIDNTAPTVSLTNPGSPLRGTIALNATATDATSGMANVVFQYRITGAPTWTTLSTDNTAPFAASWNTTGLNNTYDIQAVATDNAGNSAVSGVTGIVIDNTAPTATDIQITDGGGTTGRAQTGDLVTFTFSEAMDPASILAGWTGASTTVTVRLNNNGNNDRLYVYNAANTVATNLGYVRTGGNYVSGNRTFTGSTMVMSGNTIVVTLGTPSGSVRTYNNNRASVWYPVAAATDPAGNPMSTTTRTETGPSDRNF